MAPDGGTLSTPEAVLLESHRAEFLDVCVERYGMSEEDAQTCLADFESEALDAD